MDDQKIRLIFETLGADDIAKLRVMLGEVRAEGPQTAAALGQAQTATTVLGERAETTAAKVARVGTASTEANKGIGDARMGILDISRATQDFAQGGLGGVLNNLEGLGRAIPAVLANPIAIFGSLPALLTLGGVAAYTFYQNWDKVVGLFEESNPFPNIAGDLGGLEKALSRNQDAMGKLRDQTTLSNSELAEFNRLAKERSDLENKIEQERAVKKLEQAPGREQKDRAKSIQEVIDEIGGAEALSDVTKTFVEKYGSFGAEADESHGQQLLLNARKGNANAVEELTSLFAGGYGMGTAFRESLLGTTEVAPLKGEPINFSPAEEKRIQAAREQRLAREKKEEEANQKLNEELTKQGQENEAFGDKQVRDEAKKDRDRGEKDRARREARRDVKSDKELAEEFDTSIRGSGISDQAGAMLAQIRDQGGVVDPRTGQLRRMGADQQQAYVRRQVEQYLHRPIGTDRFGRTQFANVGMGGEETGLTAQAIVDRGQKEVTRRLGGLAGQQMGNTGRLLAVANSLQDDVTRLQAQMAQQTQGVDGLVKKTRMTKKSPLSR